jgi:hypothetical protein
LVTSIASVLNVVTVNDTQYLWEQFQKPDLASPRWNE